MMTQADWIVDIGPYAGANGGQCLYQGYPKRFAFCRTIPNTKHLQRYIK